MARLEQLLLYAGDCEQAIDLYVSAFDADITTMVRFRETVRPYPERMSRKIASAELDIFGATVAMADRFDIDSRRDRPVAGIALVMPEPNIRQAVSVLTGTGRRWWPGDVLSNGFETVEVVDPFGVLWVLGSHTPVAA